MYFCGSSWLKIVEPLINSETWRTSHRFCSFFLDRRLKSGVGIDFINIIWSFKMRRFYPSIILMISFLCRLTTNESVSVIAL